MVTFPPCESWKTSVCNGTAVVTIPATSIAVAAVGGIGTRRHRHGAIPYHSALSYSCQESLKEAPVHFNCYLNPHFHYHEFDTCILHFPSNSTSLKNPSSHIVPRRSFSLSHTSPCSHSQWSIFDQWSSTRSKSVEVDCFRLLLRIEGAGVFCQLVPPLLC